MSTERSWDDLVEQNERQEYGQAWLPDKEPDHPRTLVGTITHYDQGPVSEFTGESPWICTVADRDGKLWSIWLNRAVLINEFSRQQPLPEERIVVRYRGQQEKASRVGAAPAHLYTVTVDREQQLPGFLTSPQLEEGPRRRDVERIEGNPSDIPSDIPDADVVEESDDDPLPF